MTEGMEGKPFCAKAALFLSRPAIKGTQCEECYYIRWIGCPSFDPKFKMCRVNKTAQYIKDFFIGIQTEQQIPKKAEVVLQK